MNKKLILVTSIATVFTLANFVACGKSNVKEVENIEISNVVSQGDKKNDINLDDFTVSSLSAKTITSSSVLKDDNGISYDPILVSDNDDSTAWVEGAKGNGVNEWIQLEFEGDIVIKEIFVTNGYTKNSKIYYSNNRVKKVKLEFSDGTTLVSDLRDGIASPQAIVLDKAVKTSFVKINILDVFVGEKYQDTCIAEVDIKGYNLPTEADEDVVKGLIEKSFEKTVVQEKQIEKQNSNIVANSKKTLCECGKRYIEDNVIWKDESKCDVCVQAIIESHADNYACVVCAKKTEALCVFDQCAPVCEDHQELCPIYD